MIVRYSESLEIDATRRNDVIAFAGFLAVYQHGMKFRDCVKAIMAVRGTNWLQELEAKYPYGTDYDQPKKARRKRSKKQEEAPATAK